MGFLGGINFKQFLSEHREWHALVDGFGLVLCPFLLLVPEIRKELLGEIAGELHYFVFGGVLGWGVILGAIKVVF